MTTLSFETDQGDGFRESEFSKERRLEPQIADGHVFTQPWPAGPGDDRRDHVFHYRYKADTACRSRKGIDEQVRKAEAAFRRQGVGEAEPVRQTGYRQQEREPGVGGQSPRAGSKGYVTNLVDPSHEEVNGAYHRPYEIEKSFRMSKSDLRAGPIFHRTRGSIVAYLTTVFVH